MRQRCGIMDTWISGWMLSMTPMRLFCHRFLRQLAMLACLALPHASWALQPVDAGMQPLQQRLEEIRDRQLALDAKLKDAATLPLPRAQAYWDYQALESEKQRIETEIAGMQALVHSPLVNFITQEPGPSANARP